MYLVFSVNCNLVLNLKVGNFVPKTLQDTALESSKVMPYLTEMAEFEANNPVLVVGFYRGSPSLGYLSYYKTSFLVIQDSQKSSLLNNREVFTAETDEAKSCKVIY